jgi:hypothetical protein
MGLTYKCYPFAEQVVLLAMFPVSAGIDPCASHPVLGIPP